MGHGGGAVASGDADSSPGEDLCAFSHGGESGEGGVSVPADGTFGTGRRVGAENAAGAGAWVPPDTGADTALCGFLKTGGCGEGGFHDPGHRPGGVRGDQDAGGLRRSDQKYHRRGCHGDPHGADRHAGHKASGAACNVPVRGSRHGAGV